MTRCTAPVRRFAQLCALLAIILYQPLAALHFATDEAHLANAATSIHVAHRGHQPQADHHGGGDQPQPDHHDQQLCTFCVLAGVSLLSAMVSPALGWAADAPSGPFALPPIRAEKRLRIGQPVRAPPLTV